MRKPHTKVKAWPGRAEVSEANGKQNGTSSTYYIASTCQLDKSRAQIVFVDLGL